LPTMAAGCLSDANGLGAQAVMEKTLTTLPLTLTGADIIQGIGLIEGSMTLSLEQMIVDEEIYNHCMRMHQGIDVCQEKDYFQDIKEVAQGGHFLKQKSTRKAFRSQEFYNSKLIPGDSYDSWAEAGSKDIYHYAHEKVEKILSEEPISPVDSNTEKLVREIIEEAGAKL
ncbi:MAG: trimethylamine methyltransferase family protein, partial [Bacillota bacterium]|nr:trimethylamine methyltransferase family protein [Bacillota bacterium]